MRIVLDTNVLLSALISPHGAPGMIYRAWRAGRFEMVTSTEQIDELRRASHYAKFKSVLQPSHVGTMVNNMQHAVVLSAVPRAVRDTEINDPDDAFLFAMALSGEADFLVTGDYRSGLLQLGRAGRASIMTPTDFCNKVL